MSDENDESSGPKSATHILDLGPCGESGERHVMACRDGKPLAITHGRRMKEGQPIPPGHDVFHLDTDGKILSHTRVGNGPPKVTTRRYRNNYDRIFGSKKDKELN